MSWLAGDLPPLPDLAIARPTVSPAPQPTARRGIPRGWQDLQSPSVPWCLAAPSAPARAAHVIGLCVPPSRGWDLPPLSGGGPRVFPQDPVQVAQPTSPSPGSLQVCGLRSNRRLRPRCAALSAARARICPACGFPGRVSEWRLLRPVSGPGVTRDELTGSLGRPPRKPENRCPRPLEPQ